MYTPKGDNNSEASTLIRIHLPSLSMMHVGKHINVLSLVAMFCWLAQGRFLKLEVYIPNKTNAL